MNVMIFVSTKVQCFTGVLTRMECVSFLKKMARFNQNLVFHHWANQKSRLRLVTMVLFRTVSFDDRWPVIDRPELFKVTLQQYLLCNFSYRCSLPDLLPPWTSIEYRLLWWRNRLLISGRVLPVYISKKCIKKKMICNSTCIIRLQCNM